MAKQSFTAGQVLTAAQQNALQLNDYNQTVSTKTVSYVLVAADAGTRIVMNSASATTITVNTSLFAAGDTLTILNIGAGVCTITAGTATVSTTGSLALNLNQSGTLYFTSAGVSIFQADSNASDFVAYTPVLTASVTNPTLGTGSSATGSYVRIQNLIIYNFLITFGTSGVVAGVGDYKVSLPVTANTTSAFYGAANGQTAFFDSSANSVYLANAWLGATTTLSILYQVSFNNAVNTVSATNPVIPAASDAISGLIIYRAA